MTGFQNVAPIVKTSVASALGSKFTSTVNAVSAKLTLHAIVAMNKAVDRRQAVAGERRQGVPAGEPARVTSHVVVLGGGSSGEHFVGALRRLDRDAELTLVERRLVGGECSYWACMPTKTMLRAPELAAAAAPLAGRAGGRQARSAEDLRLARRRRRARRRLPGRVARDPALRARPRRRHGRRARASCGSASVELRVRPAGDRDRLVTGRSRRSAGSTRSTTGRTSRRRRRLEVPSGSLVLGGGPVGCELAQFFQRDRLAGDARPGRRAAAPARRRGGGGARRGGAPGGRRRVRLDARADSVDKEQAVLAGRLAAAVRPAAGRDRPAAERGRARAARARDHAPRDRGRRADARRRERLGDRRRHRDRAVHARRQVPRADRRLRHGRPRRARRSPRVPGDDLHRPAGRDGRRSTRRRRRSTWPLTSVPRLVDLRAAEARRLRQGRRRPGAACRSPVRSPSAPRQASGCSS